MVNWKIVPILRLFVPFLFGIILAIFLPNNIAKFYLFLPVLSCVLLFLILNKHTKEVYKNRWWFGLTVNLFFLAAGYFIAIYNTPVFNPQHFSNISQNADLASVKLLEPFKDKLKSYKTLAEITALRENGKWHSAQGKLIIYLQKDSIIKLPKYGDCLLIAANFKDITPPQNPGEFNYKLYLERKGILKQVYLKTAQWHNTGINNANPIINLAYNLRNKLLVVFKQNIQSPQEYAVASALIAGYTDDLDKDLITSYANTGVLHVLSVSGMHVGIIFIVFSFILSFLDKKKWRQILKAIILLTFLWMYALITGFSPAVLRSAVMLSLVIVGNSLGRNTSIYNTLCVSAFLLLLYNPYLIADVGFQLSYLAVFSIVWLQPYIYELWDVQNKYADYVWKITSVSIAAQIITCPLSLLYFHQFPNYFILANLIIIPLSTMAIYGGIMLLALAPFSTLCVYVGKALTLDLLLLNNTVRFFDYLPFSTLNGININIAETIVVYMFVILIACFIFYKSARYLQLSLLALAFIFSSKLYGSYHSVNQRKLIVYSIPKTAAYDFIDGESNVLYADTSFIADTNSKNFHIKNNWINLSINSNTQLGLGCNKIASNHIYINKCPPYLIK
jgi:competence protein ComEC